MILVEIAGTVNIAPSREDRPLTVRVRLEDTTMLDAPSRTLAEAPCTLGSSAGRAAPFSLVVVDDLLEPRHDYVLSTRAGLPGRREPARYGTVRSYPWAAGDDRPQHLELKRLDQPHGRQTMAENGELEAGNGVKTTFMHVGEKVRAVQYTVVEDHAVVEGCIIIGSAQDAEDSLKAARDLPGQLREGAETYGSAIKGKGYLWPGGRMIYEIAPDLPQPERVRAAMAHWEAKTPIRFIQRDPAVHDDYVAFIPGSGCRSAVGRRGGRQVLVLGPHCAEGNAIHEIGHALGLWHEQSRADRDAHVHIHYDRIQSGMEHNFSQHIHDGVDVEAYDLGSIMHYPLTAFSIDDRPTIELLKSHDGVVGQRDGLSAGDIATIKKLYSK